MFATGGKSGILESRIPKLVGHPEQPAATPPARKKRKMLVCPFCETTRSFSDEGKLKQHIDYDH